MGNGAELEPEQVKDVWACGSGGLLGCDAGLRGCDPSRTTQLLREGISPHPASGPGTTERVAPALTHTPLQGVERSPWKQCLQGVERGWAWSVWGSSKWEGYVSEPLGGVHGENGRGPPARDFGLIMSATDAALFAQGPI